MIELTKSEKRAAKDLIRKGILHRHAQWQQELRELLNVEEKLIRKYREQGLLSYSKVGDKYWYSQHDVIEFLNRNKFEAFA